MIEMLNESNFDGKVLGSKGKALVEIFATWCPHCQRMMPIVDELADLLSGQAVVYRVDVDKSPSIADEYAPNGVPTFVLFDDGRPVDRTSGEQSLQELEAFVARG